MCDISSPWEQRSFLILLWNFPLQLLKFQLCLKRKSLLFTFFLFYFIIFLKIKDCNYRLGACLVAQLVKNLPAVQETWVRSLVGKMPWRRKWQPTPVFLSGASHGQRSLMGYSPRDHKVSDTTERMTEHRASKGGREDSIRHSENSSWTTSTWFWSGVCADFHCLSPSPTH